MAVRFECPIYTFDTILETAGVVLEIAPDGDEEEEAYDESNSYSTKSSETLTELLEEALGEENYEKAAKIRDEIKKRKGTS
jgi:excinuclease UvrABC helicase subunit UvrB